MEDLITTPNSDLAAHVTARTAVANRLVIAASMTYRNTQLQRKHGMTTQSNTTRNQERQRKVKVKDLKPTKDPKGGLMLLPAVQMVRRPYR